MTSQCFLITSIGKASHAGLAPEEGVSAITAMAGWLTALLKDERLAARTSITAIRGGLRPNVVAPECRVWLTVRSDGGPGAERLLAALPVAGSGAAVVVEPVDAASQPPPVGDAAAALPDRASTLPARRIVTAPADAGRRVAAADGRDLRSYLEQQRGEMLALLMALAGLESPSSRPEMQRAVFGLLAGELAAAGYRSVWLPGRATGGLLLARPATRRRRAPVQLLLGHCDTVWPVGALAEMPLTVQDGRLAGPGVFDMKAGLVQMIFALRALDALGLQPEATPMALINSDEEIGSPESARAIARLARIACRALVLEPARGPEGMLKTARKGVGQFRLRLATAPSQANETALELARLVQTLAGLNDLAGGVTVNAGLVVGGSGSGSMTDAEIVVDVRAPDGVAARQIESAVTGLRSSQATVTLEVSGGINRMPLERTARNQRLWQTAQRLGSELGLSLAQCSVGGGSDGNITSQYTATLDGLGAVGDGAHARHEYVVIDALPARAALLALLLLSEPEAED